MLKVALLNPQNNSLLAERSVQGNRYCIAEANQDYHVQVQLQDSAGQYRGQYLQVCLKVDGKRVSYSIIVKPSMFSKGIFKCTFKGFKPDRSALCAFKFSQTVEATKSNPGNVEDDTGKIEVELYKSATRGVYITGNNTKMDMAGPPIVLSEGIKFWKQPSLHTVAGDQTQTCNIAPTYFHTAGVPLLTATVLYQTESVLSLRETAGVPSVMAASSSKKARLVNDLTEDEPPTKKLSREEGECSDDNISVVDLVSEEESVDELYKDLNF